MLYTNLPLLDAYGSRVVRGYLAHSIANFSAPHYNQLLSSISAIVDVISGSASQFSAVSYCTTPAGGNFEPSLTWDSQYHSCALLLS